MIKNAPRKPRPDPTSAGSHSAGSHAGSHSPSDGQPHVAAPPTGTVAAGKLYRLSWKGRITGPFTLDELRRRLNCSEISRLHRVETSPNNWCSLGELLDNAAGNTRAPIRIAPLPPPPDSTTAGTTAGTASPFDGQPHVAALPVPEPAAPPAPEPTAPPVPEPAPQPPSYALLCTAYFIAGTTFLLPILTTFPAISLALHIRSRGDSTHPNQLFLCTGAFTLLGIATWTALFFALPS